MSDSTPAVPGLPELCDRCHQTIAPWSGVYGRVRDSSFAHPDDPGQDGLRPVAACGVEHLAELQAWRLRAAGRFGVPEGPSTT